MSIKCNKCDNLVFDSRAYLKISQMEAEQEEKINELVNKINQAKKEHSELTDIIALQVALEAEKRILKVIWQCKNVL